MSRNRNYRHIRTALHLLLEAAGALGVPGTCAAKAAVEQAARRLDQRRAWEALQAALAQAEEAFRQQARARG